MKSKSPPKQNPRPIVSAKLERIIRRIDSELEMKTGSGIAEVILGSVVQNLREGDFSLITDGWTFSKGFDADAVLRRIFKPKARKARA